VLYLFRGPTGTGEKNVLVVTFDATKDLQRLNTPEINHTVVMFLTGCQPRKRPATPGARLRVHTTPQLAPETQPRACNEGNALGSLSGFGYTAPAGVIHGG
jgi:hypothetical protein